jgi:hypothetical protein
MSHEDAGRYYAKLQPARTPLGVAYFGPNPGDGFKAESPVLAQWFTTTHDAWHAVAAWMAEQRLPRAQRINESLITIEQMP